jgi:hypothetical protein
MTMCLLFLNWGEKGSRPFPTPLPFLVIILNFTLTPLFFYSILSPNYYIFISFSYVSAFALTKQKKKEKKRHTR